MTLTLTARHVLCGLCLAIAVACYFAADNMGRRTYPNGAPLELGEAETRWQRVVVGIGLAAGCGGLACVARPDGRRRRRV